MATTARPARAVQLALLTGGWILFGLSWVKVAVSTSADAMLASGIVIGVAFLSVVLVTWWWIAHNLRIYRKKGPRKSVPAVRRDFTSDFLGRVLPDDLDLLERAPLIVVVSEGERKRFLVGDGGTDPLRIPLDPSDPRRVEG
jgi:hypothetical protein